ncbi:hypothetical protein [Flexivirga oryzae]|uniref:Uncharacterized protein n=1 Tax=Flexivirga oryzae TaxID=1794944 RepID=A0A839NDJ3_9MICO|nr:hypothetical protein [Flexivirga oryzae]MBB2894034.1 hypothetical protein [Flexivirga oryzae]
MSDTGVREVAVERQVLDPGAAHAAVEGMATGTYATICAATRTRRRWTLFSMDGPEFRLLSQRGDDWQLTSGPGRHLPGELAGIPRHLETSAGTRPDDDPPRDPRPSRLAPGDALALADVVRRGDAKRIQAACDDLQLAGLPWWVAELAWGADALLSMMLTVHGRPQLATMLHLLPSGWGCLHADPDEELTFRSMSRLEVQARLSAFAALAMECAGV